MNAQNKAIIEKISNELAVKFGIVGSKEKEILLADLNDATADALDYCNRDDLVGNIPSAVKDLYIFRKNIEGVEGETSRSEGGVSQSFEEGIPRRIRSKLNRYRVANVRSL